MFRGPVTGTSSTEWMYSVQFFESDGVTPAAVSISRERSSLALVIPALVGGCFVQEALSGSQGLMPNAKDPITRAGTELVGCTVGGARLTFELGWS